MENITAQTNTRAEGHSMEKPVRMAGPKSMNMKLQFANKQDTATLKDSEKVATQLKNAKAAALTARGHLLIAKEVRSQAALTRTKVVKLRRKLRHQRLAEEAAKGALATPAETTQQPVSPDSPPTKDQVTTESKDTPPPVKEESTKGWTVVDKELNDDDFIESDALDDDAAGDETELDLDQPQELINSDQPLDGEDELDAQADAGVEAKAEPDTAGQTKNRARRARGQNIDLVAFEVPDKQEDIRRAVLALRTRANRTKGRTDVLDVKITQSSSEAKGVEKAKQAIEKTQQTNARVMTNVQTQIANLTKLAQKYAEKLAPAGEQGAQTGAEGSVTNTKDGKDGITAADQAKLQGCADTLDQVLKIKQRVLRRRKALEGKMKQALSLLGSCAKNEAKCVELWTTALDDHETISKTYRQAARNLKLICKARFGEKVPRKAGGQRRKQRAGQEPQEVAA